MIRYAFIKLTAIMETPYVSSFTEKNDLQWSKMRWW